MSTTLGDLMAYVIEFVRAEGGAPNQAMYRILMDQAIRELYAVTGAYYRSWDNSEAGDLTVDGNQVGLPDDMRSVDRVLWDGIPVELVSEAQLDCLDPDWRGATATDPVYGVVKGNTLFFNSSLDGSPTGRITVWGTAYPSPIPAVDSEETDNPLDLLHLPDQLAPAYYVVARLPIQIRDASPEQIAQARETREIHFQLWNAAKAAAIDAIAGRIGNPYTGR